MLTPNSRINQLAIIVIMLIVQGPNVALSDGDSKLTFAELFLREGLYYKPFSNVPFSGELEGQVTGRLSDGKMEGEWLFYFDNGQLHKKGPFLNGKKHGFWVEYEMSGAQQYVLQFEYGVPTIPEFDWHCGVRKKGPIEAEGVCVNGKKEGKWTFTDNEMVSFTLVNSSLTNNMVSGKQLTLSASMQLTKENTSKVCERVCGFHTCRM